MIATLSGIISEKLADVIVLEIAGIGYGLKVTIDDYVSLQIGQPTKMYIYEHIREQSHDLFGFTSIDNQSLFEQLLGVKNVGPKVSLAVLNIGSVGVVREAIAGGDVKVLQQAKGVGKRAAEQIVVELRDKVGVVSGESASSIVNRPGVGLMDEATEALIALGYNPQDAAKALNGIDKELPAEERIRMALKGRG